MQKLRTAPPPPPSATPTPSLSHFVTHTHTWDSSFCECFTHLDAKSHPVVFHSLVVCADGLQGLHHMVRHSGLAELGHAPESRVVLHFSPRAKPQSAEHNTKQNSFFGGKTSEHWLRQDWTCVVATVEHDDHRNKKADAREHTHENVDRIGTLEANTPTHRRRIVQMKSGANWNYFKLRMPVLYERSADPSLLSPFFFSFSGSDSQGITITWGRG